jgi:predicted site-specific integrase-resolvase
VDYGIDSWFIIQQENFMRHLISNRNRLARLGFACVSGLLLSHAALAEDTRQLATLPPAAKESLRQEMLDNLLAINEI